MPKITVDGHVFECTVLSAGAIVRVDVPYTVPVTETLRQLAQQEAQRQFGRMPQIIFRNAKPLSSTQEIVQFEGEDEPWVSLQTDTDTERRARQIVNTWLAENKVVGHFANAAPVKFMHDRNDWLNIGRSLDMPTTPVDRIQKTEGYTTHQKANATEQSAEVYINGGYHTLGAVVHELFHTLAHPKLGEVFDGVGPNLEEAMTEYLTCMATRFFFRTDVEGQPIYVTGLKILRAGISAGAFTESDLIAAFFQREPQSVKKMSGYYYDELNRPK
ncbi:hypothetical protein [Paraburkholderia flagellata]|uniref:hypothetical protein n=1 Tax=Paraburkholderia flagellata TaxID=2883241 RepID=UPI001F3CF258|nr:hypothetical protein [Paraburkholderia flagellata]